MMKREQIEVKALQMMPDHLHGILFVREQLPVHLGQVISGFKAGCRKAMRRQTAAEHRTDIGKADVCGEGFLAGGGCAVVRWWIPTAVC